MTCDFSTLRRTSVLHELSCFIEFAVVVVHDVRHEIFDLVAYISTSKFSTSRNLFWEQSCVCGIGTGLFLDIRADAHLTVSVSLFWLQC